jgi:hypothetical protein
LLKLQPKLGLVLLALLVAGCGKPPELSMQKLASDAPAGDSLPPVPVGQAPTPLTDRTPFGLYANYPNRDTLETLSTAALSPSGRFRAAFTSQGLWIVRVDGAWLWQVPLPEPTEPPTTGQTGAQPGLAQPVIPPPTIPPDTKAPTTPATTPAKPVNVPKATKYLGPLNWTAQSTLMLRDDANTWVEIDPDAAKITVLPAALQGKDWLIFSPDRKQVMYYTPGKTGKQLWIAKADGTEPKFLGENVEGSFDPAGKPVVTKVQPATPSPGAKTLLPDDARTPGQKSQ